MKTLIVYDSVYGNTEKIANSIGNTIGGDTRIIRTGDVNISELESIDLLIIGSPTYGGSPTPPVQDFLSRISESSLKNTSIAAFDTRLSGKFFKIFGNAANKIDKSLKSKGGISIMPPEGFFVKGTKGSLVEGEEERAAVWARDIVSSKM